MNACLQETAADLPDDNPREMLYYTLPYCDCGIVRDSDMAEPMVKHSIMRMPANIVEQFRSVSSATAYEAAGRRGALSSRIKPISASMKICGPAVTVKLRPGDNLMLHKAIYVAQPGDVIVADADGFVEAGAWGEVMTVAAQARLLGGLLFNGAIRDTREIAELGFPAFCAGVSIKGTDKASLGPINHSLTIDNVAIEPGDLVLGDCDGVVIIRREEAEAVLGNAKEREQKEAEAMKALLGGGSTLGLYGLAQILEQRGLTEEGTDPAAARGVS